MENATNTFADLIHQLDGYEAYIAQLHHQPNTNHSAGFGGQFKSFAQAGDTLNDNAAGAGLSDELLANLPELVVIPAGQFLMGAVPNDPDAERSEQFRMRVTLSKPIAVAKTPITFAQWDACVQDGGTKHRPNDHGWGRATRPVVNVSWHDAQEYIAWLNRKLNLTGQQRYRLLTEAEFEYAARAGVDDERFPWGQDLDGRAHVHYAWSYENSQRRIQPVASKPANAFGLFDMLGNVNEWVQDHITPDYQSHEPDGRAYEVADALKNRVLRGGSWLDRVNKLRCSNRKSMMPNHRSYDIGFRVCKTIVD